MKHGKTKQIKNSHKRLSIIALSALGLIISIYLTVVNADSSDFSHCLTGADCDIVNASIYSKLLGIPVSIIGALGYLSILGVASITSLRKSKRWQLLFFLSVVGFSFSVYLTYVELFIIKAICSYCIFSLLIITLILSLVFLSRGETALKTSFRGAVMYAGILFLLVFAISYAIQSPSNTQSGLSTKKANPYQINLAKYLKQLNSTMYGSYKCPRCNEQKELFGSAFYYINYVECHSQGPKANPSLCFNKKITKYPTWEIDGKFYEGLLPLDKLSDITAFESNYNKK